VLDGILRDGDSSQPRVITMDNANADGRVCEFLYIADMISHEEVDHELTMENVVQMTKQAMPLVHKFDAKAQGRHAASVQRSPQRTKLVRGRGCHWNPALDGRRD
jgi:hypothetical protein